MRGGQLRYVSFSYFFKGSTIYGYSDWSLTEQTNDEVPMGEIAGAFVFFVKKHGEERREERRGNLAKLLQSEICGTETLETTEDLSEEIIIMLLPG